MSQSPSKAVSDAEALNYILANNQLSHLMKLGNSFSGRERNCCFLNTQSQRFANISAVSGLDFTDDGRAVCAADWDGDGDQDLWLANRTGPQVRFMRNDTNTANAFVSLQLVGNGTTTNRDAIGARVEVMLGPATAEHRPLIKTLSAASGFISQSSKWVHFGLGRDAEIERVVVHWPGGKQQAFSGLAANGRFRLLQSSGAAEPVAGRSQPINLQPSRLQKPSPSGSAIIRLAARVPMPRIEYKTLEGTTTHLDDQRIGPVLLNLWASWCTPCLAELSTLGEREQDLRDAGLQVVALSVDGLGDKRGITSDKAGAFLRKLNYPFKSGWATAQNIDKLELLYLELFDRRMFLPVPASFLIDADGSLAAIYLGAVEVDQLLGDVQNLPALNEDRRRPATPFDGKWLSPVKPIDLTDLARAYTRAGYNRDAIFLYHGLLVAEPDNVELLNNLGATLANDGDDDVAVQYYRQAVGLKPDFVMAQYNLARALHRRGQTAEAIERFETTLKLTPDHFDAHLRLANLLESQSLIPQATDHYRRAVGLKPQDAPARRQLGRILARQQKLDEAAEHFRKAVTLEPQHAETHRYLGVVLGKLGDLPAAITQFRQALAVIPDDAKIHFNLAAALTLSGDPAAAIDHYRRAIALDPDWPQPVANLAWVLATTSHPDLQNPTEALQLAEKASAATSHRGWRMLEILAAAQAAAGMFDKAVATSNQAIKLAGDEGQARATERMEKRLRLFAAGKPYRE